MLSLPFELQSHILDLAVGFDPLSDPALVKPSANNHWRQSKRDSALGYELFHAKRFMRAAHIQCRTMRMVSVP